MVAPSTILVSLLFLLPVKNMEISIGYKLTGVVATLGDLWLNDIKGGGIIPLRKAEVAK
jgi:hypothetical protein